MQERRKSGWKKCVIRAYMLFVVKCYDNKMVKLPGEELLHAANQQQQQKSNQKLKKEDEFT